MFFKRCKDRALILIFKKIKTQVFFQIAFFHKPIPAFTTRFFAQAYPSPKKRAQTNRSIGASERFSKQKLVVFYRFYRRYFTYQITRNNKCQSRNKQNSYRNRKYCKKIKIYRYRTYIIVFRIQFYNPKILLY